MISDRQVLPVVDRFLPRRPSQTIMLKAEPEIRNYRTVRPVKQGTMNPRISVVMAVHDGEKYLAESIRSILSQSIYDFEFLIVDDASGDETPNILAAHAAGDDRIRIIRNERRLGPYPSANRALEQVRAPIVARMDADDVSEPGRLERQLSFFEANPHCLLVGSGYRSIDEMGRTRFVKYNSMTPEMARWTVRLTMPMVHPSFCFRRHLPDGSPVRYDESYPLAADYALAAKLDSTGEIASLGDPLVRYRKHSANISTTRVDLQKSIARSIAADAVRRHYPSHVAAAIDPLLDAIYRRKTVDRKLVQQAIRGMNAVLAYDGQTHPPAWMKQRAAGILAEACLRNSPRLHAAQFALLLAINGPRHVVPLAIRAAQFHGLFPQRPNT